MLLINFTNVTQLNKVLLLICIYLLGAIYLIQLNSYFVALSYIIVYIGAIAILFLFIIMIYNSTSKGRVINQNYQLISGPILLLSLAAPTTTTLTLSSSLLKLNNQLDIQSLSIIMFNGWPLIIILIGILLTSCLIGILETLDH